MPDGCNEFACATIPIIVCTAIPIANTNCTIETNVDYSIYLGTIRYDLALCCSHLGFV